MVRGVVLQKKDENIIIGLDDGTAVKIAAKNVSFQVNEGDVVEVFKTCDEVFISQIKNKTDTILSSNVEKKSTNEKPIAISNPKLSGEELYKKVIVPSWLPKGVPGGGMILALILLTISAIIYNVATIVTIKETNYSMSFSIARWVKFSNEVSDTFGVKAKIDLSLVPYILYGSFIVLLLPAIVCILQKNTENLPIAYAIIFIVMVVILAYFSIRMYRLYVFLLDPPDSGFIIDSVWVSIFYMFFLYSYIALFFAMWLFYSCIKGKKPLNKLYKDDFCPKELKALKKK